MPSRITQDEYLKRCREKWGDRFDLSRVKYIRASEKVEIGCPTHGWFPIRANVFLKGKHGYPKCGNSFSGGRIAFPEFLARANKKFSNKYSYSHHEDFDIRTTSLQIDCPTHGSFNQIARTHLESDTGCPECGKILAAQKQLISTKEFISRSIEKHGEKFSYSKITIEFEEGKANRQVRDIYCNEHKGYFDHDLTSHLRGVGCPVCHWRDKTTDDFIREAIEQHGDKYTYENANYTTWDSLVSVTCPEHGDWNVKAYAHTRKDGKATGCPVCGEFLKGYSGISRFRREEDYRISACELYLVELEGFWKIGIAADTDKRDHKFPRKILYRRLSERASVWVVEQNLLYESLFAKPKVLPAQFDEWDGREELREKNFLELEQLKDLMDQRLDECEEFGWEEYIQKYLVAEANLF